VFCFECLTFKNGENNKKKYGTCALEEDDSQGSDQTIEVVRVTMTFTTEKKKMLENGGFLHHFELCFSSKGETSREIPLSSVQKDTMRLHRPTIP
jgi:hypothetical protein